MNQVLIDCHIKGLRPLLMCRFGNGEVEINPKELERVGKPYVDREEAERRLYRDVNGTIYQPAIHIESCMVRSAGDFSLKGKKTYRDPFKAGVFVEPMMLPHLKPDWAIDKRSVVVQRSRVMRCRPRFDEWELRFRIVILDERIQPLILKQVLESGGRYVGIGDYRPRFGLFEILSFEIQK